MGLRFGWVSAMEVGRRRFADAEQVFGHVFELAEALSALWLRVFGWQCERDGYAQRTEQEVEILHEGEIVHYSDRTMLMLYNYYVLKHHLSLLLAKLQTLHKQLRLLLLQRCATPYTARPARHQASRPLQ